jgi:hypothetical protein
MSHTFSMGDIETFSVSAIEMPEKLARGPRPAPPTRNNH